MAANTAAIFPLTPAIGIATLTGATAVTARTNIVGTTGLVQLTPTSTNGKRIDAITVKAKATSVASNVFIWMFNATTSFLLDEFDVTVVTATNTVDSFVLTRVYQNLVLPPTFQLYISETVSTDVTAFAFGGDY